MPPLLLDDDEAIAIAVGLRTAAGASVAGIEETSLRALVKLEQVLPAHLRRRVRALQSATSTLHLGRGPEVDPQCLTVLAAACRDFERVRFAYRARDTTDSRRDVEPHALVNAGRRWYLVAWDRGRDAWRTFRVDRITRPASAGARFRARTVPGRDPAAFVARSLESAPRRYEARVTLHAPAQAFMRRRWLGGKLTPLGDERCELRTSDDDLDWLAMRIVMLGVDFEAHEPPELVERLRVLGGRIRRSLAT
jgi:predicted DNA-binding transcriptional regulator YafY